MVLALGIVSSVEVEFIVVTISVLFNLLSSKTLPCLALKGLSVSVEVKLSTTSVTFTFLSS